MRVPSVALRIGLTAALLAGGVTAAVWSTTHAVRRPGVAERVSKACLAPTPPAQTTRFGVYLSASPTLAADRRREQRRFGPMTVMRLFDPSIPPANAWERRTKQLRGMQIATSFRMPPAQVLAGKYDAALRHFFKTAPRNRAIYWSYYHEPEPDILAGKFTEAQYRDAFKRIVTIAGRLCRANLYPTLILTGWTADPASGRDWRTYSPGDDYISVLGWDPYNQAVGVPRSYRSADAVFGDVVAVSAQAGKPWAITETGTARTKADPSGKGRAKWLTQIGNYLLDRGPLFVTYFQSRNRGDFELRDRPSVRAYRRLVSAGG